jgi:hypothetical protein
MAAGLILLALMASLVLSRTRNGPAALSSLRFNEIDMELVDLEPQTFEVKLDREFSAAPCKPRGLQE